MDIIIRKFHFDDVPALVPLRTAVEQADRVGLAVTEDETRQMYSMPSQRAEENSFVAEASNGQLVGAAWVTVGQGMGETVFNLHGHVHPAWRRRGIGQRLLDATIARTRERMGETIGRRAWLQSEDIHDEDAARTALFERNGFHAARWALDMCRELPGLGAVTPLIPIVEPVPGVQLRKWHVGIDNEAIGWMLDEAFRDHWGYTAIHMEDWLQYVRSGFIRTEHSVLAWDATNGRLAGACVNLCDERIFKQRGRRELYVGALAVRREYRKRGVATALLTWTLHRAHHLDMQSVGLDADAENLTGAVRLYTRLGFSIIGKMRVYRRSLV